MAQLEEAHRTYKQSTAGAEATIKELKDQLEQARSNETRSYDEEIQRLKVEFFLKESMLLMDCFMLIRSWPA